MTWKILKRAFLQGAKSVGLFQLVGSGRWRRSRLLILCYHGVSLADEHEWNPGLYISRKDFERRLNLLATAGCSVLSFDAALRSLRAGDLPARAVTITFDDGYFDFYSRAYPLLAAAGVPVTVYLATLRCDNNKPVFNLMASYLLWKARGSVVEPPESLGAGLLDLRTPAGRAQAETRLRRAVEGLGPTRKDELLAALAARLGIDYRDLKARRLLTVMNPAEVAELAAAGVDFQLHTHSHRTPPDRDILRQEITKNSGRIQEMTGVRPVHFCYPSGIYNRQLLPWLAECEVVSATTCDSGLASPTTNPLLLPRVVDTRAVTDIEFEGWLSGVTSITARRPRRANGHAAAAD